MTGVWAGWHLEHLEHLEPVDTRSAGGGPRTEKEDSRGRLDLPPVSGHGHL